MLGFYYKVKVILLRRELMNKKLIVMLSALSPCITMTAGTIIQPSNNLKAIKYIKKNIWKNIEIIVDNLYKIV